MPTTPKAFDQLRDALAPLFVARGDEIDTLFLSLVARCHFFLLSTPGTAKTMLFREFLKRVDGASAFYSMFDPLADDSLILGPQSIPALTAGRREREVDGYLPEAELWLCDEVWNASSALLQCLHEVVLDRTFKQGAVNVPINLWTMLATSNRLPAEGEGLEAIWDRVALRRVVEPIRDAGDMRALLNLTTPDPNPDKVLSWADVVDAHEQAMALPVTTDAQDAFINILVGARIHKVQLSGRRMLEAQRIAQANAWLSGAAKVGPEHFDFLTDFLWDTAEQRAGVAAAVLAVSAPLRAACGEKMALLAGVREELQGLAAMDANDPARRRGQTTVYPKLTRIADEVAGPRDDTLERRAATVRDRNAVDRLCREIAALNQDFVGGLMGMAVPDILAQARAGNLG